MFYHKSHPITCCEHRGCAWPRKTQHVFECDFIADALERGDTHEAAKLIQNINECFYLKDRQSLTFTLQKRPEWMRCLELVISRFGTPQQYRNFKEKFPMTSQCYPSSLCHTDQATYLMENHMWEEYVKGMIGRCCILPEVCHYLLDNGLTIDNQIEFDAMFRLLVSCHPEMISVLDRVVAACRDKINDFTQILLKSEYVWHTGAMSRYVRLSIQDTDPNKLEPKVHHVVDIGDLGYIKAHELNFLKNYVGIDMSGVSLCDIVEEIVQCDPDAKIMKHHWSSVYSFIHQNKLPVLRLLETRGLLGSFECVHLFRSKSMECIRLLWKYGEHGNGNLLDNITENDLWEHVEELMDLIGGQQRQSVMRYSTAKMTRAQRICVSKYLSK